MTHQARRVLIPVLIAVLGLVLASLLIDARPAHGSQGGRHLSLTQDARGSAPSKADVKGAARLLSGPVYTLDAQGFQTRQDVADLWSKNTGLTMVVGSCVSTDPYCIHATVGNLACGTAGCSTYDADACEVQVAEIAMTYGKGKRRYDTQFNVLGHEVGHCVLHSSWHASDGRDIMYFSVSLGAPRRTITNETKAQLALIYG